MIYIGKVRPSIMEAPIEKDIIRFFSDYEPMAVVVPDDEDRQKALKTTRVNGIISGNMSKLIRKNENISSRDCLILDLDSVVLSEYELVNTINQKFKRFSYVLYPSISHEIKGVRYRLLVPLDRNVEEQDYKLLVNFFLNKVLSGVIEEADQSNLTWSQIQLLPVITQYTTKEQIIVHKGEEAFPTTEAIETAKSWSGIPERRRVKKLKNTNKFKKGGSRYRTTTTELFESLVSDVGVGNRNNRIAQLTGGLLARAVDVALVLELVQVANQHFSEPLPEIEVEETFFSIARKELGAD
ncbi:MAG: primase C-terminal domain-containing protein [Enterococcus sp.]